MTSQKELSLINVITLNKKSMIMSIQKISFLLFSLSLLILIGCDATKKGLSRLNLFAVEDDIALGKQVNGQIQDASTEYPVLPERGNEEAYKYIRDITNTLLNSGKVAYKDKFAWQVKIIDDDETLNAFATPGGYIYVYTGLIKFLDSEDQLAGVMGHEIAHAARRHSTNQMTKSMGVQLLTDAALGQREALKQVAGGLLSLRFSRSHESDADDHSVIYLCETGYNPTGAAGFFKKIQGQGGTPEFLSTHPNPGNRVKDIQKKAEELGCPEKPEQTARHNKIKTML